MRCPHPVACSLVLAALLAARPGAAQEEPAEAVEAPQAEEPTATEEPVEAEAVEAEEPAETEEPVETEEPAETEQPAEAEAVEAEAAETEEPAEAEAAEAEEPAETEEPVQTEEPVETGEAPAEAADTGEASQISIDAALPTAHRERNFYQITGIYELHHNLISDEQSANDWYSYYLLRGDLNLTDHDQVSLRFDLTQDYISDPGESGLWFGDIRAYYSRSFSLPIPDFEIPAKASFYLTAPTSRVSQERGYITKPTAFLTLAPSLGPVTLLAQGLFQYAFARYTTSETGDPNTQLTTGFTLQLFYAVLPWFAPSVAWETYWSLPYQTRENEGQSMQAEYYFEVAANFTVPMPEAAPSLDISLAYAQGANVLEDGVSRFYFAKRDQTEVYLGLNFTY